jgi:hypothetical protein
MSTYTPIASQTTTGTTASITFTDIPQTYQDLVLVCQSKISTSFADIGLQFNNDTGTNYADVLIVGYVSTAAGGVHNNANFLRGWYLSSSETYTMINLMNYTNTTNYKQVIGRSATVSANEIEVAAGSYRSTSPITTITLTPQAANFLANSTFNLYGIASGGGKALGGDTVTTDGTYWYHTFVNSGAFVPTQNLTNVDYLVVAGGGGGGDDNAGGGGAGGLRCTVTASGGTPGTPESKLSLTANTVYPVLIGGGGYAGTLNGSKGGNGFNSSFGSIQSIGGGAGGGDTAGMRLGISGGSGGGGAGNSASAGGAGTANQGFAGGNGSFTSPSVSIGGGGGGASAVGANASGTQAGAGGAGVATSITGSSVTYAGGGGGGAQNGTAGAGGAGGGGAGAQGSGSATNADANTGGGGGGGRTSGGNGANGGSGIVIVRYAV